MVIVLILKICRIN